jgi:acetyl/propionyl-CoA carboxylase alpha subunit
VLHTFAGAVLCAFTARRTERRCRRRIRDRGNGLPQPACGCRRQMIARVGRSLHVVDSLPVPKAMKMEICMAATAACKVAAIGVSGR